MNEKVPITSVPKPKKRKRRKPGLNLTPSKLARRYAVMMQTKDNRPSITNMVEHLIFEEKDRRNITPEDLVAFEKKTNGKNKHKGKKGIHQHEHTKTNSHVTRWQSKD